MGLLHMFLGIDLGTSGIRVLLVNAEGRAITSAEVTTKVSHPHLGWSEQDPSTWVAALEKAVAIVMKDRRYTGLKEELKILK